MKRKAQVFPTDQFINGEWVKGQGAAREIVDPTSGEPFAVVHDATPDQAQKAIGAAARAGREWRKTTGVERAAIMRAIADLITRDAEELAQLVVQEQGKPITEARGEVGGSAAFFNYFSEFARRIRGEILPSDIPGEQILIQRVPVGVVAAIIPWNYPSALVARKVAPAMIAGDTVVVKPHELTPLSALRMARLFEEAGVPPGVLNIVTGSGTVVGAAITASRDVSLISMTGSVRAGKQIMRDSAENLTQVSLELGGKAPFIVLEDADLDLAARSAVTSRFMNCGQVCICNERTLVARPVYDEFLARFVDLTSKLKVGDPRREDTDIGPKVSLPELEKVELFVEEALVRGAKAVMRGGRPTQPVTAKGFWLEPTVLTNVAVSDDIMHREIFGPVIPIVPFDNFEDAVSIANDSHYGLSAYLFTNNFGRVMAAMTDVDFGEVYVNRIGPESLQGFHVGYRESGVGGDDGEHGLEAYLRKKTVYLNGGGHPAGQLMPYGRNK